MGRINIFNYEAFYLDFLEGKLSEEDTLLLNQFLEQHPELKVDDEDLFLTLENDSPVLEEQFKADLKQISFNETTVTAQNLEQFLIAETEGLLSTQKQNELKQLVSKDAALLNLQKMYTSAHLVADTSIIYSDKKSLKQSKRIVLWPYVSLVAASIAILFLIWNATSTVIDDGKGSVISHVNPKGVKDKKIEKKDPNTIPSKENKENSDKNYAPFIDTKEVAPIEVAVAETPRMKRSANLVINGMKPKQIQSLSGSIKEQNLIENNTLARAKTPTLLEKENEYTTLGFNDMKNPIKPITNRLGDVVKKEVDFRTAKATEKQSGGFYLKIGKLEISRRKF